MFFTIENSRQTPHSKFSYIGHFYLISNQCNIVVLLLVVMVTVHVIFCRQNPGGSVCRAVLSSHRCTDRETSRS